MTELDNGDASVWFTHNHYQYDNVGREVARWRDEGGNKGERFWFNPANEITRAVYQADNVWSGNPSNWNRFRDYNYTPDLLNWTSVNDNGYVAPLANNAMNQYTGINGFAPSYDGNFNQTTSYYGQTFVYNAQNQLVDGSSVQATYDGLGRCVRRTVGGNTLLFTYDDWNPITEWDGAGNWRGWTIYGAKADEVLLRFDAIYGPQVYKHDNQGSVTFILDGPTHVAEKYTYDVYGRPTIMDGAGNVRGQTAIGNRYMFTGREWIADLQLYDYRHRFYNPDNGRFLQTDPTGFDAGDMNLFRYCGDDPVDRSDPTGLISPEKGLMDVSKETLRAIWAEHVRNVHEAMKPGNWEHLPGGRTLKPEYGTIVQRYNGKLQPPKNQKGEFVGANHQPQTKWQINKGKGWTTDHIDHVHTTMAGHHYDQDIPTAEHLRTISAVGTTFDNGRIIELYVPRAELGGRGSLFKATGPENLTDLHGHPVPH